MGPLAPTSHDARLSPATVAAGAPGTPSTLGQLRGLCLALCCYLFLCGAPLHAQEPAGSELDAPSPEAWRALSREERVEILHRFERYRAASPAERERWRARAEVLGRHARRLIEDLRAFEPERLEALRAQPAAERRAELRRLLEQRMETEVEALRERLGDARWRELRELRGGERSALLSRHLREQANTNERKTAERWAREGRIDPAIAAEIQSLPFEERGPALRRALRQNATQRIRAQIARHPELFPEPFWRHLDELDERTLTSALRTCRERVQRSFAGLLSAIPPFLLPPPQELRRLAALPPAERREAAREAIWERLDHWARRAGVNGESLARWRGAGLERALQEVQRWRALQRREVSGGRERRR